MSREPLSKELYDETLPRGYLSGSGLGLYGACPHAFKLRYVDGYDGGGKNLPMAEGIAMHDALEGAAREAKEGRKLEPVAMAALYAKKVSEFDVPGLLPEDIEEVSERGAVFLDEYVKEHLVGEHVVDVELKVEGHFAGTTILGYVDLVEQDSSGKVTIVDYKVTGRKKNKKDLESAVPMALYSALMGVSNVAYHQFVKTKKPYQERVDGRVTARQHDRVENFVGSVADAIRTGNFPLTSPDSWSCRESGCSMWKHCKQGGGDK